MKFEIKLHNNLFCVLGDAAWHCFESCLIYKTGNEGAATLLLLLIGSMQDYEPTVANFFKNISFFNKKAGNMNQEVKCPNL